MITVLQTLMSLSRYPIDADVATLIATQRGIENPDEANFMDYQESKEFYFAQADIYNWLATAPNISQGGQTYSLSDKDKANFARKAQAIYDLYKEPDDIMPKATFGYKGNLI